MVQEIFGVSGYIQDRCQDLADEGYVVYAPDLYDRLPEKPVIDPASPDYLMQGMSAMQALDWQTAATDIVATLEALRARSPASPGPGSSGSASAADSRSRSQRCPTRTSWSRTTARRSPGSPASPPR